MKLDDILTEDERLDLWVEMNLLAAMIHEYTDRWWDLDIGLRRANARRSGVDYDEEKDAEISD